MFYCNVAGTMILGELFLPSITILTTILSHLVILISNKNVKELVLKYSIRKHLICVNNDLFALLVVNVLGIYRKLLFDLTRNDKCFYFLVHVSVSYSYSFMGGLTYGLTVRV